MIVGNERNPAEEVFKNNKTEAFKTFPPAERFRVSRNEYSVPQHETRLKSAREAELHAQESLRPFPRG
jgi:hypothetical protein